MNYSYYNYFALEVLFWPFAGILPTACGIAFLTSPVKVGERWWENSFFLVIMIGITLGAGWFSLVPLPQMLIEQTTALMEGPQQDQGVIDSKDSVGGRARVYTAIIDGKEYLVSDSAWWHSLCCHQRVQFVHDPARTAAFQPTQIALTPFGILLVACFIVLWLITIEFVLWKLKIPLL